MIIYSGYNEQPNVRAVNASKIQPFRVGMILSDGPRTVVAEPAEVGTN